jgi:hypothetical protein
LHLDKSSLLPGSFRLRDVVLAPALVFVDAIEVAMRFR